MNDLVWKRSSAVAVSLPVDATNDWHVMIELRRANDRLVGKRLRIIVEGSYDGGAWYPLNMPTLVFPADCVRIIFTLNVWMLSHWRLRTKPKSPGDLLMHVVPR